MNFYQAKSDCIVHTIADETILFKTTDSVVSNNSAIIFNETGAFLWNRLQGKTTKEKLVKELCIKYGIIHEVAMTDVEAFLEKCVKEEIIFLCEA